MAEAKGPDGEVSQDPGVALPEEPGGLPPIDFSTFIVSLRTSALIHLGTPDDSDLNLDLARQEIDLLGLLQEKTRGNLSEHEAQLLRQILFELRTRYLSARAREAKP